MGTHSGHPHARGSDDRDRVKDATDIVRLVGDHVELRARGREYVGLCPFHDDHSPSMAVVPAKQIFHCFACGAGGDAFSFVMRYHRMEFPDALRFLADRAGIELSRDRSPDRQGPSKRSTQAEANAVALSFFQTILGHGQHGMAAREVIERRGISEEMVEAFLLGASPDRWDGLLQTLESKRIDTGSFAEVGLLKVRETGGMYDAFRNRLIFPIHDQAGRVIAFGGRKINEEDEPKYLNSPESELFDKSSTLYGLHQASRSIQTAGVAIVTEGYTDVIACHQAGFTNAVATLGTALTPGHARVLRRLCDTVVLLFDGDEAGLRAADRAVEVFFSEPVDVRIATLSSQTDAKDPDELLKRDSGAEVFQAILSDATDILDYRLDATRRRLAVDGISAFERAYEEEIRRLAGLGLARAKPVRKQRIVQRLVELTGMDVAIVNQALTNAGPRSAARLPAATVEPKMPEGISPAEWIVGAMLSDASLMQRLPENDDLHRACDELTGRVLEVLLAEVSPESRDPLLDVLSAETDETIRTRAVQLERRVQQLADGDRERLREEFSASLSRLERPSVSEGPIADRLAALRQNVSSTPTQGRRLPRPFVSGGDRGSENPGDDRPTGLDIPPPPGQ